MSIFFEYHFPYSNLGVGNVVAGTTPVTTLEELILLPARVSDPFEIIDGRDQYSSVWHYLWGSVFLYRDSRK